MNRLAVVGSINTDFVVRTSRFPSPGETVIGESFAIYGGGKGANQAIAAARLDAIVEFFGAIGQDANSSERLAALEAEAIGTKHISRVEGSGGVALIQVETATGQNSITLVPGANGQVLPEIVGPALTEFCGKDDIICLQLEIPFRTVTLALDIGRRCGAVSVLNATPFDPRVMSVLHLVDVLIVNEIEAGQILGTDPVALDDAGTAAKNLRSLGVREAVIITLGSHGAWLSDDSADELIPAREVEVVDTTGAGDAFCGAFCASLARGVSRLEAAVTATVAGSLAVQRHGAQPSLPSLAEIQKARQ